MRARASTANAEVGGGAFVTRYAGGSGALQWKRVFPVTYGQIVSVRQLSNSQVAFAGNLSGVFTFGGQSYEGGLPEDRGYENNFSGFAGTLSPTGADAWIRDMRGTLLWQLVPTGNGTFAVSGFGTRYLQNLDLGGGPVGSPFGPLFIARYSPGGQSHLWSRTFDSSLKGFSLPWLHLAEDLQHGGLLVGGEFSWPLLQDGEEYTPKGGSDLFYFHLRN